MVERVVDSKLRMLRCNKVIIVLCDMDTMQTTQKLKSKTNLTQN